MRSAIELGESLSKFMIPIIMFEKFRSKTFITTIKVIYMPTHSSKSYNKYTPHKRDDVERHHPKREKLLYRGYSNFLLNMAFISRSEVKNIYIS